MIMIMIQCHVAPEQQLEAAAAAAGSHASQDATAASRW